MLLQLPIELIGKIFSYLPVNEILQTATLSNTFYTTLKNNAFWSFIDSANPKIYEFILNILITIKKFVNAKKNNGNAI